MIKLAQYESEKFERFLDQEDSEYSPPDREDFIIHMEIGIRFNFENTKFLLGKDFVGFRYCIPYEGEALSVFKKDKKDPLNRFGGLFNGRTYGQGEFVLIRDDEDDIFKRIAFDGYEDFFEYSMTKKEDGEWQPSGNLHENPELYEKIK